jgi:putative zinc finger protein
VTDCGHVRDLLPEWALGVLREDRAVVEEHLVWCAGCRHEARELADGASAVALVTEAPAPPPELEDRVVGAVSLAAARRRGRSARVGVLLAAALALVVGGLAGALAGRSQEPDPRVAAGRAERSLDEFGEFLLGVDAGQRVLTARLEATGEGVESGRAVVYDSPGREDFAVVVVGGLPRGPGPYWGMIRIRGDWLGVGRLDPAEPGQLAAYRLFDEPITGYLQVSVRDRRGDVVLVGTLASPRS